MKGQNLSSAVMQQRTEARDAPLSRKAASASGSRYYFTGRQCIRGHIALRSVSDKKCLECNRVRCAEFRTATIEARRAYDHERYHGDSVRRAAQKAQAIRWGKANKGKRAAIIAARRAWIKLATPGWLTTDHRAAIRSFYLKAAALEGEWHVDHIVPLRGRSVCGLNVPWNLQLLSGDDNRVKGNRHGAE